MTYFILKRHGPTESDSRPEDERTVKSTLENEGTVLKFPEGYLYSLHFGRDLAGGLNGLLPKARIEEIVLATGDLVRTQEDAEATHQVLEMLGVRNRVIDVPEARERGLGDLSGKKHKRLKEICGEQGIHHTLFYERDFKGIIDRYGGIEGDDYGESFGKFIGDSWNLVMSLLREYKRNEDVVVLHTHSLRSMAVLNVLHRLGYWSFKKEGLTEHIFNPSEEVDINFMKDEIGDPLSGYRWIELNYGEYLTVSVTRHSTHLHVTEYPSPSLGLRVEHEIKRRPDKENFVTKPIERYRENPQEYAFLESMIPLHEKSINQLKEKCSSNTPIQSE